MMRMAGAAPVCPLVTEEVRKFAINALYPYRPAAIIASTENTIPCLEAA